MYNNFFRRLAIVDSYFRSRWNDSANDLYEIDIQNVIDCIQGSWARHVNIWRFRTSRVKLDGNVVVFADGSHRIIAIVRDFKINLKIGIGEDFHPVIF